MKSYVIYNYFFEPQGWYLDGRLPDALLIKHNTIPIEQGGQTTHHETGIPVYTSLGQFKTLIKKNPQGVLIIEDWESFYRLDADKRHEAVSYKTVMPFWVVEKIVQAHVEVHLNNAKVAVEVQNRNQTAS